MCHSLAALAHSGDDLLRALKQSESHRTERCLTDILFLGECGAFLPREKVPRGSLIHVSLHEHEQFKFKHFEVPVNVEINLQNLLFSQKYRAEPFPDILCVW